MTIAKFQGGDAVTMTSIELLELVNEARAEFGEGDVRRNDFTARCRDELAGEHYETFVVQNLNKTESVELRMTRDQCMWVLMRESKAVRRRVTTKLNRLEQQPIAPALPGDYISALEHLLESKRSEKLAIEQRDYAIETKAEIGSRREATAMATASAAVREARQLRELLGMGVTQATIVAVEKALGREFGRSGWRPLKKWCQARGINAPHVIHPTFGSVIAWPAAAWMDVYQIDLADLFGADGEQA
ncbi:hypothetical protein [Pseudomonas extremaustralis]|uniref:Uncharacterized protein n=1 Tax=Pseudomonas extremaustralis TaxID=359110 RepID=A0A5C5QG33_9PSED|nr:hypothetical protein [Pseudomonas extremaustralis]EZI28930.1 hypothetical protein PE143B_0109700 [Pseudomonas extremaustralis 14-3 substr. 14-3b]TWS04111.1 hypothetical protein FIV36_14265 [Pseudomonas extremaustralis]SDF58806.1 hypothetical protein SAMN05216591_3388 [Pseudomonas extremaustralis]